MNSCHLKISADSPEWTTFELVFSLNADEKKDRKELLKKFLVPALEELVRMIEAPTIKDPELF